MAYYFNQITPDSNWQTAKQLLWKSIDPLGKEGSNEKEEAVRRLILPDNESAKKTVGND